PPPLRARWAAAPGRSARRSPLLAQRAPDLDLRRAARAAAHLDGGVDRDGSLPHAAETRAPQARGRRVEAAPVVADQKAHPAGAGLHVDLQGPRLPVAERVGERLLT